MKDPFARLAGAAHSGAFGLGSNAEPTPAQIRAGNYAKGSLRLYGLPITIETPMYQPRRGKEDGVPWEITCMAHYGYINGVVGADGDNLDVFVGPTPESLLVVVVNQVKKDGSFDEHKCVLGFHDVDSALLGYTNSYMKGWKGLGSYVACSVKQFKAWIKDGDLTRPLAASDLTTDEAFAMNDVLVKWDAQSQPIGQSLGQVLYALRGNDTDQLLLDSASLADVEELLGDDGVLLDAMVIPFNQFERKANQLLKVMGAAGGTVKAATVEVSKPFKNRGTTQVAMLFGMDDGQSVAVFFHNPDSAPNKLAAGDELISWKWVLNKKDITVTVAPEKGQDLNPRQVARRIMGLVEKNSAKFIKGAAASAEKGAEQEALKAEVAGKTAELQTLEATIEDLKAKIAQKPQDAASAAQTAEPGVTPTAAPKVAKIPKPIDVWPADGSALVRVLKKLTKSPPEQLTSLGEYSKGLDNDVVLAMKMTGGYPFATVFSLTYERDKWQVSSVSSDTPKTPGDIAMRDYAKQVIDAVNEMPKTDPLDEKYRGYVQLAADSVKALRTSDVYRVITSAPAADQADLGAYLAARNPKLAAEVQDVLADLQTESGAAKQEPAGAIANAEGSNASYMAKTLAEIPAIKAEIESLGGVAMTEAEFMERVNAGTNQGFSLAELQSKLTEAKAQLEGVQAGSVTPRSVTGKGGTKKGAIAWLQQSIDQVKTALASDGFMYTVNVSNYQYNLHAQLRDLKAKASQPDMLGDDPALRDSRTGLEKLNAALVAGNAMGALGILDAIDDPDALRELVLKAGFSLGASGTKDEILASVGKDLVRAAKAKVDGFGLRDLDKPKPGPDDFNEAYPAWESAMVDALAELMEIDHGDAQGVAMAQDTLISQLYVDQKSPQEAAQAVAAAGKAEPAADEDTGTIAPEGRENTVKTAKGTKVVTGFKVIEAKNLVISHSADGTPNPDYPSELQPRDRARATSQAWVAKTARSLDPDSLGRTNRADSGAPIVGPDRVVESGNGRAMAIREAYRIGQADEYRAWLIENADYFKVSVSRIEAMKAPILVRVRTSEVNRAEFAVEANQDDKLAMTATEKARSDAKRLDTAMLTKLADGDLSAGANRDFIAAFLQSLGDAEAAQYLTSDGRPTSSLISRIQAALFAGAYSDDRLLELTADVSKPEIANIVSALNAAAPDFMRAKEQDVVGGEQAGERVTDSVELSLNQTAVDSIINATNMLRQAKDAGLGIDEFLRQGDMFGDIDPAVAAMAVFISANNRSAKRLGTAFKAMAQFVETENARKQTAGLFGDAPASFADIVKAANAKLEQEYGEGLFAINQDDLFSQPAATPAAAVQDDKDTAVQKAKAYLDQIIDGSADLGSHDDVIKELERIYAEFGEGELSDLFNQAAEAFSQYALKKTAEAF